MRLPTKPPRSADITFAIENGKGSRPLSELVGLQRTPTDAKGRYLHWDQMRYRTPPSGLTHEEWWLLTKMARDLRPLPMTDALGEPFGLAMTDTAFEMTHRIDQQAAGSILSSELVSGDESRDRYLIRSLVEEAITSSQMEGAATTRVVAKEMLLSGREPRDRSERMILNNYLGMMRAREMREEDLTADAVLELHRVVTEGTLEDPAAGGRLQKPGEHRVGVYWGDGTLLHKPPPAELLPSRLEQLCDFANGHTPGFFIHPVVRAILVHFWLAYDHPFEDGNGRTARALFYWSMLRQGYWLAEFLSISSILRRASRSYVQSFLYTETDDLDTTYFVIHQLQVIVRAIEELHDYLERKQAEVREVRQLLHGLNLLNYRQMALLGDALHDPAQEYTIATHAKRFNVVYQSARTDLLALQEMGLLGVHRVRKKFVFTPAPDLAGRLRQLSRKSRRTP